MMSNLKIDLGCGSCKKKGTIGIDIQAQPGVDYVLDLRVKPLPFPDQSVEYVYSSHFLEHLGDLSQVFQEISRVCKDGAKVELWTPYLWSNSAFIFDHKIFFNEEHYLQICVWFPEFWEKILNSRWILKEIIYIIEPRVLKEIYKSRVNIEFALKYYKEIVKEFCVIIEVRHGYKGTAVQPRRTFSIDRFAERHPLQLDSQENVNSEELKDAIEWFTSAQQEQLPQIRQNQGKLTQLQSQLQRTQAELQAARTTIAAMKTSKFWKLRGAWFNFKRGMGIKTDE